MKLSAHNLSDNVVGQRQQIIVGRRPAWRWKVAHVSKNSTAVHARQQCKRCAVRTSLDITVTTMATSSRTAKIASVEMLVVAETAMPPENAPEDRIRSRHETC